MKYNIALYCPDSHIEYDINTLERKGVGGGITARVRIAHALADRGHEVLLYVNCPENKKIQGVQYLHHTLCKKVGADIFIASSSGGDLNLGGVGLISVNACMNMLMIHGMALPRNVEYDHFDCVNFPSNFVRDNVCKKHQINPQKIFVAYRGVEEKYFKRAISRNKDPYAMVYLGHPEKGLDDAISILRILRKMDPRFTLNVFGGYGLWGDTQRQTPNEPGLSDHGLVGQKKLARHMEKMSFSLNLQAIQEGFGLAVCESMRAGCIVLASNVGAYPEVIRNGYNGFLINGNHAEIGTHLEVAELIYTLTQNPYYMNFIRQNAFHTPLTWQTIAKTWEGHWDWHFKKENHKVSVDNVIAGCEKCYGNMILLADGCHCVDCGHYQQFIVKTHDR